MKRLIPALLCLALSLSACSVPNAPSAPSAGPDPAEEPVALTLWTYPVGGWGNGSTLSVLTGEFRRAHPDIEISVRTLDYATGDAEIEAALAAGEGPDLVFEGPERLCANWGAHGLMADLSDLWESEASAQIYESVASACRSGDGAHYIYPVCMTTHCMAVNRDLFEAADAWQYVDEQTHTWTTQGFIDAVAALRAYGVQDALAVYCNGQGGDQGTRALITNLYSGAFTDPAHTRYTFDSPQNVAALELLAGMDGVRFAPELTGADEAERFCAGELAMSLCWNVGTEVAQTISNPARSFDIFPVTFPTDDGRVSLQGGIWGLGVFDHGDARRVEAAKTFIRYMTQDMQRYTQAVLASSFWPVRDVPNIYENDELMTEYYVLRQYLGDYYQVTPGWAEARTAWWTMLQQIGEGGDIPEAVAQFEQTANAAASAQ